MTTPYTEALLKKWEIWYKQYNKEHGVPPTFTAAKAAFLFAHEEGYQEGFSRGFDKGCEYLPSMVDSDLKE